MENDIDKVVEVTEGLRASNKGRYLENIAKACQTKHGWTEDSTKAILDEAIEKQRIQTTLIHNKLSYRKFEQRKICIEDDCENISTQTDSIPSNDFVTKNQFDQVQNDFIEFKRYTHGEILSMKAEAANRSPGPKVVNTQVDKDREALFRCLQERIISLERQLQDKQFIIEKLLGDHHRPENSRCSQQTPFGTDKKAMQANREQSDIQLVDLTTTKEAKKTTQAEQSGEEVLKQRLEKTTTKCKKAENKHADEQNNKDRQKEAATKSRKRITIVGDSMLNGIVEEGMQKDHNVQVKRHPGATSRDIVDYVKPVIRKKPDCIIIHTGTNDLTCQEKSNTIKNLKQIVEEIRQESPNTTIVLSAVVTRKDKQALDKKVDVMALNGEMKGFAKTMKIPVIDNSNIDPSCLSRKKLHLNEKGSAYLARNFLNFIKTF
ncbi:MAG: hypothetical protein GY823_13750 [Flavobacteriaceae bacterium]|nr:hypothetical protein [Flavobacteriaceae bacterium]